MGEEVALTPVIYTIDIETRPNEVYAWSLHGENIGPHKIIRPGGLLMFAAQRYGSKTVESHAEWDGYEQMVRRAHEIYDAADYIVTYNGARFDNRHLRAAWAELGYPPPSPWRDIDLYKTVRKFNWPSRKLSYVCGVLGLDHKADDGGFETWDHILRGTEEQQATARRRMVRYCRNDVRITTQLFERLLPWVDGLNLPLQSDEDGLVHCARCNSTQLQRRGWAYTTSYRYRRYQCQGCGGWLRARRSEPTPNAELRGV